MNPILISKTTGRSRESSRIRFFSLTAGALLLALSATASSCHTARGFGRDIEDVGEEIQEATAHH